MTWRGSSGGPLAAAPVMAALRDAGVVGGWRDELFPVSAGYGRGGIQNKHSTDVESIYRVHTSVRAIKLMHSHACSDLG